jgi:hypothetical protein
MRGVFVSKKWRTGPPCRSCIPLEVAVMRQKFMHPVKLARVAAQISAATAVVAGSLIVWAIPFHYPRAVGIAAELVSSRATFVVIGDSITEIASPDTVCGERAINAGIANYTTEDYVSALKLFKPLLGHRRVIVALGTNDTWPGTPSYERFGSVYRELLRSLTGRIEAVVLVPPSRYGGRYPDRRRRDHVNRVITELTTAAGIPTVMVADMPTSDGVHPNARGTELWQTALQSACPLPAVVLPI